MRKLSILPKNPSESDVAFTFTFDQCKYALNVNRHYFVNVLFTRWHNCEMSAGDNGVAFYMDDALVARIAYTDCLERSVMPTVDVTNIYVGASTRSQVRLVV